MGYLDRNHPPFTAEEVACIRKSAERLSGEYSRADAEAAEAAKEVFELLEAEEADQDE